MEKKTCDNCTQKSSLCNATSRSNRACNNWKGATEPSCIQCKLSHICKIKEKSDALFTASHSAIHDTGFLYKALYEGIAEHCDSWEEITDSES